MKLLIQFGIIFGVCWVGEGLSRLLPLPGSVISMILLFLLLLTKLVKPAHIAEKSDFLLKNMAFFFIPAGVAIMESLGILWENLIPFLTVCFVTMVITFAATAYTVRLVIWLQNRLSARKEGKQRG
ncbi:MAG TPA: CidA/LrgA family protein [Candidatus Merdivicinus excrementipullorum]|uniref:CidA/LrgA family protein n=1 Tax=Candidatus Merdivicinus excrementipullorum TaxID=2840867 RepID=A0A9D1FKM5_9FIRM|nr:CidA/LrgA family protein [Candidatus Merdivicinus excrementipullorum]